MIADEAEREPPQILYWCGKRVDQMDRDELLKAFMHLWQLHEKHAADEQRRARSFIEFWRSRAPRPDA